MFCNAATRAGGALFARMCCCQLRESASYFCEEVRRGCCVQLCSRCKWQTEQAAESWDHQQSAARDKKKLTTISSLSTQRQNDRSLPHNKTQQCFPRNRIINATNLTNGKIKCKTTFQGSHSQTHKHQIIQWIAQQWGKCNWNIPENIHLVEQWQSFDKEKTFQTDANKSRWFC